MSKSLEKTRNYYNGIAKGYQQLYHEEQKEKILACKHQLPTKGNIVDLGAGDGVLNQFLAKEVNLFSVDISSELLALNPTHKTKKILSSIENLPFENEFFEGACSFSVLQDVPHPKKALRECSRILKPGGKFIVSFIHLALKKEEILQEIPNHFSIIEELPLEKDLILILQKH